jgi:hypothetical protein
MAILQVEKIINSGVQPSFTPEPLESVTNLGNVTELQTKQFKITLPATKFDSVNIESPYSHITVTRTGLLTIDQTPVTGFIGVYNTQYYFYVVFKSGIEQLRVKYVYTYTKIRADIVYKTPGTYSFLVPIGITSISALGIAAGGGGYFSWSNSGGGGGCLAAINSIPVMAGQVINITVPGTTPQASNGGSAVIGTYFSVQGGTYSQSNYLTPNNGGSLSPDVAGQGGHVSGQYGGGGGAGGYGSPTGTDARGGYTSYGNGYNGNNGAGAGGTGYNSSTYSFGGGGGVYPYGRGSNGVAGSNNNGNDFYSDGRYGGGGGSNGEKGADNSNGSQTSNKNRTIFHGEGGQYGGGGGGGGTSVNNNSNFCRGAQGVVRISYGFDLAYPTTNTAKQSFTVEI